MIIKSASIKVTQVGQAAYDIWFIKSGQVISYYRLPRDSVDVGSRELSLSSGSLFPFEADSVKIGADFVVNENILIINSKSFLDIYYNNDKENTGTTQTSV